MRLHTFMRNNPSFLLVAPLLSKMTYLVTPFTKQMSNDTSKRLSKTVSGFVGRSYEPAKYALIKKPTEVLKENSPERPDVAKVAILGYN